MVKLMNYTKNAWPHGGEETDLVSHLGNMMQARFIFSDISFEETFLLIRKPPSRTLNAYLRAAT
jgi:hypothetical protein